MRKKRSKKEKNNVIALPASQNNMTPTKATLFTCDCGGQLFTLRDDGTITCHSCRTKQPRAKFRVI